jgi:RHS repeat-associated protein
VLDRASADFSTYDARGRVTRLDKRVAKPNTVNASGVGIDLVASQRYAPRWYSRTFSFDAADREIAASTGAEFLRNALNQVITQLLATTGASAVTTEHSRRGKVKKVGSSYGVLIGELARSPDGRLEKITYGDLAQTKTEYMYDERRRVSNVITYRGPPASGLWTSTGGLYTPATQLPPGDTSTAQLLLQDEDYFYDVVGNPIEIHDWRDPDEWPAGAKPVSKRIEYDDLNRATRIDYEYAAGDDTWTSPFKNELGQGTQPLDDQRRSKPSRHVQFAKRVLNESFEYDWLGNTKKTSDDANGFYDRSLGAVQSATSGGTSAKPYQLTRASNKGVGGGREGELWTAYDVAGNLTRLDIDRDGPCLVSSNVPSPTDDCSQRFEYRWDEVNRLVRARRWDTPVNLGNFTAGAFPSGTPAADLRNLYDAGDQRVLKEAVDSAGQKAYAAYVFETLELRGARYGEAYDVGNVAGISDYEVTASTAVPYLLASGMRVARLVYEIAALPTLQSSAMPTNGDAPGAMLAGPQLHLLFELGDHLGSTSVVLDKATGELVERSTFQGYGATEGDYRPERWKGFREDYKFTGKEEDVEVGLQYFGKRFLNPHLGRWASADPLAVHAPGAADLNLYAYVSGSILKDTDPLGLFPGLTRLPPPKLPRSVTVVRSGGVASDRHAMAMDRFVDRNYGKAGAPPKVYQGEYRRSIAATTTDGNGDAMDIVRDIGRAADATKEALTIKTIAVIVHGDREGGIGRQAQQGSSLSAADVRNLGIFKRGVELLRKDGDEEAVTDYLAAHQKEAAALDVFETAARKLEAANVQNVELQGCDLGNGKFGANFGYLLSTEKNKVRVGTFTENTNSYPDEYVPKVSVGETESQKSSTTLPTPQRSQDQADRSGTSQP